MNLSLESNAVADAARNRPPATPSEESAGSLGTDVYEVLSSLSKAFAEPFAVVDVESGDLIHSDHDGLSCDFYDRIELLGAVSRRGIAEIVEDVAPLTMLAIPLRSLGVGENLVAVGLFVNQRVSGEDDIAAAARALGIDVGRALRWSVERTVWPARVLEQMAHTVLENLTQRQELGRLGREAVEATAHLEDVYAELDLLHHLTSQLHLSENEQELWQNALSWLADTIPAQCLAIVSRNSSDGDITDDNLAEWGVMTEGECPVDRDELCELIRRFGMSALRRPILLNRAETTLPTWHCPTIRELVCVPIDGGESNRGWLLALNHRGNTKPEFCDFGSVEIQLLSSVGTILGIHHSNLGLYREQSQLFASSVQALTSAIDAKDRYTSGHSNRVAYLSLKLAEQLGLNDADRETIYLAGLLHDIGKIGIDDQVLNKPGELTDEEFEHIKLHPQLGYDILQGVQQLDKVLPIVLHHHEAWDGSGYPHGLKGLETPKMARIMAVADSFDAMSSDRPYRKGMPDEKLDAIFREGSGEQWDAEVVAAFFAIRDEARRCAQVSSCQASLEGEYTVE
ncbi:MAG: HD-GYP domain-containing protein [Bythopirellula sp.]